MRKLQQTSDGHQAMCLHVICTHDFWQPPPSPHHSILKNTHKTTQNPVVCLATGVNRFNMPPPPSGFSLSIVTCIQALLSPTEPPFHSVWFPVNLLWIPLKPDQSCSTLHSFMINLHLQLFQNMETVIRAERIQKLLVEFCQRARLVTAHVAPIQTASPALANVWC